MLTLMSGILATSGEGLDDIGLGLSFVALVGTERWIDKNYGKRLGWVWAYRWGLFFLLLALSFGIMVITTKPNGR